ncbi:hypothetical protein GGR50DRAFT_336979 [Xylaria sp. CBS 124048]|nr:hypothetical protein GGR50DRAFT_336979 [Xylaria sp. CBS 124048]
MEPAISRISAEPTLYEILSLTSKQFEGQTPSTQQKIFKQAYHKALLTHHPDKRPQDLPVTSQSTHPQTASPSSPSSPPKNTQTKSSGAKSSPSASRSQPTYTIDQIQHAYSVLSDARQRREYDRQLLFARSSSVSTTSQKHSASTRFHTGIETVDLDDLDYDERTGVYYGPCRCGNDRGFQFTEAQLEEHEDDLVLTVQCLDCSLWMRVLFNAAEESGDDDDDQKQQQQRKQSPSPPAYTTSPAPPDVNDSVAVSSNPSPDPTVQHTNASSNGAAKAWTFNLGFNWGFSLSGGVSANTTTTTTTTSSSPDTSQS